MAFFVNSVKIELKDVEHHVSRLEIALSNLKSVVEESHYVDDDDRLKIYRNIDFFEETISRRCKEIKTLCEWKRESKE
jgi:hypothetical protein